MKDAQVDSLQQALTRLHAELARSPQVDDKARVGLRSALAEIEQRLKEQGGRAGDKPALPHGLDSLAVGFEAVHPSLAASLRQFIELLSQAGL
jgi:hypothetical protein